MVSEKNGIHSYLSEYQESITGIEKPGEVDWSAIQMILAKEHGWTEEGAGILVDLVQDYGSFILSHALALAIIEGQEDGRLGM